MDFEKESLDYHRRAPRGKIGIYNKKQIDFCLGKAFYSKILNLHNPEIVILENVKIILYAQEHIWEKHLIYLMS